MDFFEKALEKIYDDTKILKNLKLKEIRDLAKSHEIPNKYGIPLYHTKVTSRSVPQTINNINLIKNSEIKKVQREIEKVLNYLKRKELISCKVRVGNYKKTFGAESLVTKEFARLSFMNRGNFFKTLIDEVDVKIIDVPEWKRKAIYVDPETNITFILGTDYYGELKMSILRLVMNMERNRGGLGLHAGSKLYKVLIHGKIREVGVLIFGLSGTGKTTITINNHNLKSPEGILIMQDDINLWNLKTYCSGTEKNFYIKTDNITNQKELLKAVTTKSKYSAIENVRADLEGNLIFDDVDFCSNGRAIVVRNFIPNTTDKIDIERTDIIIFNTRRHDIPIAGRFVSPEQAATYFMLGESTKTSAETMDTREMEIPVRIVGFDPFIVDEKWRNGLRFFEILKKNPKTKVYLLNTGKIGGLREGVKIQPEHTLNTVEAIVRDSIEWKFDENVGYDVPKSIPKVDLKKFDPYKIYDRAKFERLMKNLKVERIEYLKNFPEISEIISL